MLKSMTGFGRCERDDGRVRITVEVRSVNNRFLDMNLFLPAGLSAHEAALKKMVEAGFARGRVEVRIDVELDSAESGVAEADLQFARSLKTALEAVASELALSPARGITLEHLLAVPGVVKPAASAPRVMDEPVVALVRSALTEALSELSLMREKEGRAMAEDLAVKLDAVSGLVERVEALAPLMKEVFLKRLRERVALSAPEVSLPEDRLVQEAVLLAERSDITEEIVRLKSHVSQFRDAVGTDDPSGRKLDFLAQEMNREGNTIAAKARSTEISNLALEIRAEVEKIREQVRNVE